MIRFITLEGPEGSGKTTVAKRLLEALTAKGFDVLMTREPGGSPIAEEIRQIILDRKNTKMDPKAEALLFAASRRQHLVETIYPALAQGKVVLCDRFIDSSLAYQGFSYGLGVDEVLQLNLFATEGKLPDLTLLFDVSPEVGLRRIAQNKGREVNRLDLHEIEVHRRVQEGYLYLAKRYQDRIVVIDANRQIDEVFKDSLNVILGHLKKESL